MSWDIFIQDFPPEARVVEDIPDDYRPRPIGTRSEITQRILEVVPGADFTNPCWGVIRGPDCSIQVDLGEKDELDGLVLHVRGGDLGAGIVADLLRHLGLRAIDTGSGGFFDPECATESLRQWRAYRDQVVGISTAGDSRR